MNSEEQEEKLEALDRALNRCLWCQAAAFMLGAFCLLVFRNGFYVGVLFGQTIGFILFGIVTANRVDALSRAAYPHLDDYLSGRRYNPMVLQEARKRENRWMLSVKKKQMWTCAACAAVDFGLYILASWVL